MNTAIEECTVSQLRCVVLDELHMIDDAHRGYLLELMTTKLLSLDTEQAIQIIAMSATLPVSIARLNTSKVLRTECFTRTWTSWHAGLTVTLTKQNIDLSRSTSTLFTKAKSTQQHQRAAS